jgi:hypothetical protein
MTAAPHPAVCCHTRDETTNPRTATPATKNTATEEPGTYMNPHGNGSQTRTG